MLQRMLREAKAGILNDVKIYGTDYDTPDGTCIRDYIHINDLAAGHLLALEYLQNGASSAAFNLGNGSGFSVKEVIQAIEQVTGKSKKLLRRKDALVIPPSSLAAQIKQGRS